MSAKEIVVHVKLDERTFRRFSRFDTLKLRKKRVRPAAFAGILTAFAVAALLSGKEQAGLIAAVLLAVGLGLPLVYFGTFFSQVRRQAVRLGLKPPRAVYTVRLDPEGVVVTNDQKDEEPVRLKWSEVQAAFRARDCVYLYANSARAYLLPDGQASVPADELWAFVADRMGARARRV